VDLVGVDAVGLGSDWDGYVAAPFDSSHIGQLAQALLENRFSEDQVEKIMGRNVIRTLSELLP
jgi:microsomal dipeptidase-like Zn-dependent dipeptidase